MFALATLASASPLRAQPHAAARLVSDVASIRAGEPFTVGLHITLDEGWRTPWRNAGDVGNGPIVSWTLPEGFRADSLAYPVPQRIAHPPVTSYGYHREVVMLATLTPPRDLRPGRVVRLGLSADFVICGHTCIPVHAERSLELAVSATPPATSADAALVRAQTDRLPVAAVEWQARVARTDDGFVLEIAPPRGWRGSLGGAWFFPADPGLLDHAADQPMERTAGGAYRFHLTRSAYLRREPRRVEGVLVLPEGSALDAAGHRGLVVSAPLHEPDREADGEKR